MKKRAPHYIHVTEPEKALMHDQNWKGFGKADMPNRKRGEAEPKTLTHNISPYKGSQKH